MGERTKIAIIVLIVMLVALLMGFGIGFVVIQIKSADEEDNIN